MRRTQILAVLASIMLLAAACSSETPGPVVGEPPVATQPTATPSVSTTVPEPTATSPAISPAPTPTPEPTATASTSTAVPEPTAEATPLLSTELVHDCDVRDRNAPGPPLGEPAIEFALRDVDGNLYTLSELLQEKPVVLVFGSFT